MTATINAELARILAEHPDLPVKVHISGELAMDVDEWCIGELYGYEVTEYIEHERTESIYFGRDNEDLRAYEQDDVWDEHVYAMLDKMPDATFDQAAHLVRQKLSDAEADRLTDERIAAMDWKPCIRLSVGS